MAKKTEVTKEGEVIILSDKNKSILKEIDAKLKEISDQFNIVSGNKQNILIAILNEKQNGDKKFKLNEEYNLVEVQEESTPPKT